MMQEQRLINEFMELVQIDSESKNERKIADILKMKFASYGLKVIEDNSAHSTGHGAGNLICTLKGTLLNTTPIFFCSHMDTVAPGQGIKPSIKDGYVVSDGSTILGADDKAGIAAMLETIRILKENQIQHGTIQFILTVGEERGLVGAKALDLSQINAKYGYVLDHGGQVGNIVTAAPSQAELRVEIFGKAAHAGLAPEQGISAITIASQAIAEMRLGRIDEETTANIGHFQGIGETNIVCDYVQITAEVRSMDTLKLNKQVEMMKNGFEMAAYHMGGQVEIDVQYVYPGFQFDEGDSVVQIAKQAADHIGCSFQCQRTGGGSDANILAGLGIPTVNLAVGYEDIHTTHERLSISEFGKCVKMMVAIIEEVAKR
ncbi:M20/M25/M40 family metallo-hydrolase [Longirhabdus pacifica]|uniref:M20/M25/M40 family metallo-hydrolase n=1 Tax=Longirhabdus pacifica TaxID=2305227 RepID=UPI0010091DE9|nr:M20/M25/M40 family metallo-hydrolase [Longirhabdus pacifica]